MVKKIVRIHSMTCRMSIVFCERPGIVSIATTNTLRMIKNIKAMSNHFPKGVSASKIISWILFLLGEKELIWSRYFCVSLLNEDQVLKTFQQFSTLF